MITKGIRQRELGRKAVMLITQLYPPIVRTICKNGVGKFEHTETEKEE
jgi:hypothetical protein